mgnify:CR=1 FL=1
MKLRAKVLQACQMPVTYPMIAEAVGKVGPEPFALGQEIAGLVVDGALHCRDTSFGTCWPLYCASKIPAKFKNPRRDGKLVEDDPVALGVAA